MNNAAWSDGITPGSRATLNVLGKRWQVQVLGRRSGRCQVRVLDAQFFGERLTRRSPCGWRGLWVALRRLTKG